MPRPPRHRRHARRIPRLPPRPPGCPPGPAAGSFRRAKETVHDLDLLVATTEPGRRRHAFATAPSSPKSSPAAAPRPPCVSTAGSNADLRAVSNAQFPFALQYFTGSKEHNVALRSRALKQGLVPQRIRLHRRWKRPRNPRRHPRGRRHLPRPSASTRSRPNSGKTTAKSKPPTATPAPPRRTGRSPRHLPQPHHRLRRPRHPRRNGRSRHRPRPAIPRHRRPLESRHSRPTASTRTASARRSQGIRQLNAAFARDGIPFVFAGSEVDILKDGTLDFDDELLAELDYVVASVHNVFTLPEDEHDRAASSGPWKTRTSPCSATSPAGFLLERERLRGRPRRDHRLPPPKPAP